MKSITGGVAKCEVAKTGDPGTQPTRVAQVSRLRPGVIACKQSAQKAALSSPTYVRQLDYRSRCR
jgi:hypothetical protein